MASLSIVPCFFSFISADSEHLDDRSRKQEPLTVGGGMADRERLPFRIGGLKQFARDDWSFGILDSINKIKEIARIQSSQTQL